MYKQFLCHDKSAYIITDRLTVNYLIGLSADDGILFIADKAEYFADARSFDGVKEKLAARGVVPKLYKGLSTIKEETQNLKIETLFLDFDRTTVTEYNSYSGFGVKLCDCSEKLKLVRSIKNENELDNIQTACKITERAYYESLKEIKIGITEKEIRDVIEKKMLSFGAESISFETIVAFGKNAAIPHHVTDDTKLQQNNAILVDTGCKVNGYCSDYTRTAFFGNPDAEFIKAYDAVEKANVLAEEKITVGMKTDEADKIARDYLDSQGYGEYFTHSLGHGLGLEIHEYPYLSPRKSDELKENCVFTIEPGVYLEGKFGIRVEDTVTIKNGKVKRLFGDEKKLLIL